MENAVSWDCVQGNWKETSGQAKQKWGKLTHYDIRTIQAGHKELEGLIQKHYGYAKYKAKSAIDSWLDEM